MATPASAPMPPRLPPQALPTHTRDIPPAYPGETFLSTWTNAKFYLGASDPHTSGWSPLSAFYGFGTAHLSTCRLLFILHPPISATHHVSIPLVWLRRDRLHIRRPFFDVKHVSGVLIPSEIPHTHVHTSVFTSPGKPMHFRIEMLDPLQNDNLCRALRDQLADPDRVARNTRALIDAVDSTLVCTGIHFAFVDPRAPHLLHLTSQMAPPSHAPLFSTSSTSATPD